MPRSEADHSRELAVIEKLSTLDARVSQLREDMARIEKNAAETEKSATDTLSDFRVLVSPFEELRDSVEGSSWTTMVTRPGADRCYRRFADCECWPFNRKVN